MIYPLVHELAADRIDVAVACRVLEIPRSSYYDWLGRPASARDVADAYLIEEIREIHTASRETYGAPRVHDELRLGRGRRIGRKRIARLMRLGGPIGICARLGLVVNSSVLSKFDRLFNTFYSSTMKTKPEKERLLRNVIALRVVELEGGPELVGDVRDDLERLVGATVSRATAARVLGISQTALDRHIGAGSRSVVETPGGRYEVPTGELVSVAVELRRHASDRHPVAAVIDDRRRRAAKLTAARLLPGISDGGRGHRAAELRALAFHRAVALQLDLSGVRDAERRLRRWQESGQIDPRWAERWVALLDEPLAEIRRAISADDEAAADLRQSSPFAGSLSEPERRRVFEIGRSAA